MNLTSEAGAAPEQDAPGLSSQLCFDLYAASRAVTNAYRPILDELQLTYPQYLVLVVLWEVGSCTVGHLCESLHLDYGTLTPLLRRMETSGLLGRQRHPEDERVVIVELHDKGEALRVHATRIHCDMIKTIGLERDEFVALQETLRVLTSRVTQ